MSLKIIKNAGGLLFILLFSLVTLYFYNSQGTLNTPKATLKEKYSTCTKNEETSQIEFCLKQLGKEAYANYSIDYINSEFQELSSDLEKKWCHQTMHYFGSEAYKTESSLLVAFSLALDNCDSGMYHGIVEAFLYQNGTGDTVPQLIQNVCEEGMQNKSTFTEGYLSLCYHGLGHGLMLFTANDLQRSLDYCDLVVQDRSNQCRNGVYMEHSQDHTGDIKSIDIQFCTEMKEPQQGYCFNRFGSQNLSNANGDIGVASSSCTLVPDLYKNDCLSGVAEAIRFENGTEEAAASCLELKNQEPLYSTCITFATSFYARIDRGNPINLIEFCSFFKNEDRVICITKARNSLLTWLPQTEQLLPLCMQFKETADQAICLMGYDM